MPYVERVFLVVSDDTQVPHWVNRSSVEVVLHEDIIPHKYLPTFNSNVIECYFHNIRNLAEEFVYFNDDFFVMRPTAPDDFFMDGKTRVRMKKSDGTPSNMFRTFNRNSWEWAMRICGKNNRHPGIWMTPQHSPAPMLKSVVAEVMSNTDLQVYLRSASTPVRDYININQYIFTDAAYLAGKTVDRPVDFQYMQIDRGTLPKILDAIDNPPAKTICLNDSCSSNDFPSTRKKILEHFAARFTKISKYEINMHSAGL